MNKLKQYDSIGWDIRVNTLNDEIRFDFDDDDEIPNIDFKQYYKFENAENPIQVNIELEAVINQEKEKVAKIELYLMNAYDRDIFGVMDGYSVDTGDELIYNLLQSKEYELVYTDYCGYEPVLVGVLQEFYVFPEFRQCGVSSWIDANLIKMVRLAINANIGCLITQIRPYKEGHYGEYVDKDNEMTALMCKVFEKLKWRKVKKNVYIKDFVDYIKEISDDEL